MLKATQSNTTKLSITLKKLMAEYGLNTAELARATNVLQPVMHRMVAGHTDNPRIDTLLPVAKYFKITVNQLMGEDPLPDISQSLDSNNHKETALQEIPLLKSWHEIKNFLHAPSNYAASDTIYIDNMPNKELIYALKAKDSTMLPRFPENTILIVDGSREPQNGDFAIIELEEAEDQVFKQVFYDSGDIYLKPLNSDFKTTVLKKDSAYKFLGVAVESRSRLKLN